MERTRANLNFKGNFAVTRINKAALMINAAKTGPRDT